MKSLALVPQHGSKSNWHDQEGNLLNHNLTKTLCVVSSVHKATHCSFQEAYWCVGYVSNQAFKIKLNLSQVWGNKHKLFWQKNWNAFWKYGFMTVSTSITVQEWSLLEPIVTMTKYAIHIHLNHVLKLIRVSPCTGPGHRCRWYRVHTACHQWPCPWADSRPCCLPPCRTAYTCLSSRLTERGRQR